MGYIEDLRMVVGHQPIILAGAAALVIDGEGRLLMGFRSDNRQWGIPGGGMEPGETLEETARREALEETGMTLDRLELFGVFSGPEFFYTYPNGDQVYNVSIVYVCREYHGQLNHNEEHGQFQFFDPRELLEAISPPVRLVLQKWVNSRQEATL